METPTLCIKISNRDIFSSLSSSSSRSETVETAALETAAAASVESASVESAESVEMDHLAVVSGSPIPIPEWPEEEEEEETDSVFLNYPPTYQEAIHNPTTFSNNNNNNSFLQTFFSFPIQITIILTLMAVILLLLTMELIGRQRQPHTPTNPITTTPTIIPPVSLDPSIIKILEDLLKIIRENDIKDPKIAFLTGKMDFFRIFYQFSGCLTLLKQWKLTEEETITT